MDGDRAVAPLATVVPRHFFSKLPYFGKPATKDSEACVTFSDYVGSKIPIYWESSGNAFPVRSQAS